jgi:hypothetical protein
MKLMVAGCSYSAVSSTHPGTAWSELLAQSLGWELINLARQGCSNGAIRIQIDEILRQRPDFAIVTPTFWDRMEIPAASAPVDVRQCDLAVQDHLRNTEIGNGYDAAAGLDNINYGNNASRMISETIYTLAANVSNQYRPNALPGSTQTAVKHYINCLYDSNWKKQQDQWIIKEGVFELFHAGINFLFVPVLLWPFDARTGEQQWREILPQAIPGRFTMSLEPNSILPITGNNPAVGSDPGYHSAPSAQKIIANKFKQTLKEQKIVKGKGLFDFLTKPQNEKYKTDNVWVYYSAFEPIARIEANESVPQDKIVQIKKELHNEELWEISRAFSGTTFFLYTDEQVKRYENSETRKVWADKYFEILEPYNEFGYFEREKFNVYLDSKENFDNNYESNWYYYYK